MRRFLQLAGGEDDALFIQTEERTEGLVARVSGEVDLANAHRLKAALQSALSSCRHIILDISALRYIDSTGLHILVDAQKTLRTHNCHLVIVGASPSIAKVIRVLHLDSLMPLRPSLDAGLEFFRRPSPG